MECYLEGILRAGSPERALPMALARAYIRRIRDCVSGLTDLPQDVVELAIKRMPTFHKTAIAKLVVGSVRRERRVSPLPFFGPVVGPVMVTLARVVHGCVRAGV